MRLQNWHYRTLKEVSQLLPTNISVTHQAECASHSSGGLFIRSEYPHACRFVLERPATSTISEVLSQYGIAFNPPRNNSRDRSPAWAGRSVAADFLSLAIFTSYRACAPCGRGLNTTSTDTARNYIFPVISTKRKYSDTLHQLDQFFHDKAKLRPQMDENRLGIGKNYSFVYADVPRFYGPNRKVDKGTFEAILYSPQSQRLYITFGDLYNL